MFFYPYWLLYIVFLVVDGTNLKKEKCFDLLSFYGAYKRLGVIVPPKNFLKLLASMMLLFFSLFGDVLRKY